MFHILIVEDSDDYMKIITRTLGEHKITGCTSAEDASVLLRNNPFDLVIADINLPNRDGYSLLTELRADPELSNLPVLCLTGRKDITDKVTAFSLGADDFITKPFDPIELSARVNAKLKRELRIKANKTVVTIGDLEIDQGRHSIVIGLDANRREVDVTQTEFKLLWCLSQRLDQVFTRDQLLIAAWGSNAKVLDRAVDVHICSLRKKIGAYGQCIKAITGVGYKMSMPKIYNKVG